MDQVGSREYTETLIKQQEPTVIDTNDAVSIGVCQNGNKKADDEGDALGNTRGLYQSVTARMSVEQRATHYKMDHPSRGVALIFNHEHFQTELGLKSRSGTAKDCEVLEVRLKLLGFDVHVFKDLQFNELMSHVDTFAKKDHSDSDCFLMAVLSHGELGIIYARDTPYKSERLWSPFTADRCPTLAGKPKMFFIQACQGDKLDGGVTLSRTETDGQSINSYRIPSQADFLIAYSTVPGYFSWRNTTRGSWFIQALCEELEQSAYEHDLLTLLTFVSQRVAFDFESNVPDTPHMHRQKQIPSITSMLTRLCKFTKSGNSSLDAKQHSVFKMKTRPTYRERTYL